MRDYPSKRIGNGPELVGNMIRKIFDLKQVLLYHKVKGRTKCLKETGKPNTDIGSMFPRICSNFSGALKAQRKK